MQILINPVCSRCTSEKKGQSLPPSERTRNQQVKLAGGGVVANPGSYAAELLAAEQYGP